MSELSYNDWTSMSDAALVKTIGTFVKTHRLSQNRTQDAVAEAAGISRSTLSLLERGEKITLGSLIRVLRILDLLYVMDAFTMSDEISPVEYARLRKKHKKRARKKQDAVDEDEDVSW